MTERKPADQSWTSWVDQQIDEAARRGAFDDLPGYGKPLPRRDEADDGLAWVREYVRREGGSTDELLPESLRLRKERERLAQAAPQMRSEQQVRDAAADLNERILRWRRIPVGPPVHVPLADADDLVSRWREAHPERAEAEPAMSAANVPGPVRHAARPRWWRRR